MENKIKPENIKEERPNLPPKISNYLKNIIERIDNCIEESSRINIYKNYYRGLILARKIIEEETGL